MVSKVEVLRCHCSDDNDDENDEEEVVVLVKKLGLGQKISP